MTHLGRGLYPLDTHFEQNRINWLHLRFSLNIYVWVGGAFGLIYYVTSCQNSFCKLILTFFSFLATSQHRRQDFLFEQGPHQIISQHCGTDFQWQHLECTRAAVTSWTSPHLPAFIRATKSSRKNCTSELSYQKPKEFFKVTPKNQKILICPLLIHCQSAYNSKFIFDIPRFNILNNMVFKMGVWGLAPNHNCPPPLPRPL